VTPRRAYLLRSRALEAEGREGLAASYRGLQLAQPGTPLPDYCPHREALAEAGYEALEDLPEDPDEGELRSYGLTMAQASEVFLALKHGAQPPAEPVAVRKVQRRPKGRTSSSLT
jgi:hypothetical protein